MLGLLFISAFPTTFTLACKFLLNEEKKDFSPQHLSPHTEAKKKNQGY